MSEALTENQETKVVETPQQQEFNAFDETTWVSKPLEQVTPTIAQENLDGKDKTAIETKIEPNYNDWVKTEFGFDSVEVAKTEFDNYKKIKEATPQLKFENEQSEQVFNLLKDGKTDEVYSYLDKQKKIDKILNADITESNAEDIIKLSMQNKYKDLTADEIDYQFNKQFKLPKKPSQSLDQTDDEYEDVLKDWTSECNEVKKGIIIEAKLAKPEIAKLKSELVLPTIEPKPQNQPSQEDLQKIEKWQKDYESSVEAEYKNFNGVNVTAKCGDAELPITYSPTDEDKTALRNNLLDFDAVKYLEQRWVDATSQTVDVKKAISELYFLENKDAILQKVANESAAKMLEFIKKTNSNIQLENTGKPNPVITDKSDAQTLHDKIWEL
jgi:hypothetical protein